MTGFVLSAVKSAANLREHWAAKARRVAKERQEALTMCRNAGPCKGFRGTITFTRYGWRMMDDDNLRSACKAYRDGIAQAIGVDDGSAALKWEYRQVRGKPSLVVTMEPTK